ncbi:hypothetical protein CA13_12030 [Planctomycetes bacterium CA13]|uniref:Uncharacterized protein n=1 Tax=Novipirellula herctigrandis TaxID=2527986 RepID=A0A5C5YYP0_9BACT|nr:hypothetical protein CA13_12030 [Planctomycetes bacterium CA13]
MTDRFFGIGDSFGGLSQRLEVVAVTLFGVQNTDGQLGAAVDGLVRFQLNPPTESLKHPFGACFLDRSAKRWIGQWSRRPLR